ncbi:hypothetical protein ASG38_00205 [Flavobacterium sp. Leaf359]|nr:hypothetical protein ASG38_00205 [Flavobacterium sp. Leaf359]
MPIEENKKTQEYPAFFYFQKLSSFPAFQLSNFPTFDFLTFFLYFMEIRNKTKIVISRFG